MPTPYAHIAVCVDESEGSERALAEARRLFAPGENRLSIVHVATSGVTFAGTPDAPLSEIVDAVHSSEAWLARTAATVEGAEPVLLEGEPSGAVVEWARDAGVDLLVASSSRGFLERLLLGSFATHLTRHAPCSVLLVRPRDERG
ncbi:MAG: universal stress protein [Thermoleophilia bacterium]